MKKFTLLIFIVFSLPLMFPAKAALIAYYEMDSLIILSDVIVLCEELGFEEKIKRRYDDWTDMERIGHYKIQTLYKGEYADDNISISINSVYRRKHSDEWLSTLMGQPPTPIPLNEALLFLRRDEGNSNFEPVTGGIKLIQKDVVLRYGQFAGNPGPLLLKPQLPENLEMSETDTYLKDALIQDLKKAFNKAEKLDQPIVGTPW